MRLILGVFMAFIASQGWAAQGGTSFENEGVFGIADTHAHPFANEGFGGSFFQGQTFHAKGMSQALHSCEADHGWNGLADIVGNVASGRPAHSTQGYPLFIGWPQWNDLDHQKMYYEWLLRAYQGGLRLIVAHAVNNESLCGGVKVRAGYTCDDMEAVDRQIAAAYALEDHINQENHGRGWLKIVRSSREARQAIGEGKLVMVLGIEVDEIFHCRERACTSESVAADLEAYYAKGVRHIIPIHVTNNAFGGSAFFNPELFDIANLQMNGAFIHSEDCSALGFIAPCNSKEFTGLGRVMLQNMMRLHMIIDVDHMDAKTSLAALDFVERYGYPVVSGHTGFVETSAGRHKHEGQKTDEQTRRIMRSGGLVGPILEQGKAETEVVGGKVVANDCDNSSKAFAQAYLYAARVAREEMIYPAISYGSDMNGMINTIAPRFGSGACNGNMAQAALQNAAVVYPFVSRFTGVGFDRQQVGLRSFDYNTAGFAQVGMLPDFVEDLEQVGVPHEDLLLMFHSAEAYLRAWEKAESISFFSE